MREEEYRELVRHVQGSMRQISEDLDEQATVSARNEELPSRFLLAYLETVIQRLRLQSREGALSAMSQLNESLSGEARIRDVIVIPSEVEAEVWEQEFVSLQELPDLTEVVEGLREVVNRVHEDLQGPRRNL